MRADYTDMIVILDRSGSMANVRSDMEGGFNTLIEEQRKAEGKLLVSLYQFDDHFEVVYEGKSVHDVPPLSLVPRGGTALNDALGIVITNTGYRLAAMPEAERPSKVMVVIITDGHENASKKFSKAHIREIIAHQQGKYSWVFNYLGADINAEEAAAEYSIPTSGALSLRKTKGAVGSSFRSLSQNMYHYRLDRGNLDYTDEQKTAAQGA
jgi:uncharacterized protein YegL